MKFCVQEEKGRRIFREGWRRNSRAGESLALRKKCPLFKQGLMKVDLGGGFVSVPEFPLVQSEGLADKRVSRKDTF